VLSAVIASSSVAPITRALVIRSGVTADSLVGKALLLCPRTLICWAGVTLNPSGTSQKS